MNIVTLHANHRTRAPWTARGQAVDNARDPWKHTYEILSSVDQTPSHPQVFHDFENTRHLGQRPVVPSFHSPDDEGEVEIFQPLLHHLCGQTQGVSP